MNTLTTFTKNSKTISQGKAKAKAKTNTKTKMVNLVALAALAATPFFSSSTMATSLATQLSAQSVTPLQQNVTQSSVDENVGMGTGLVLGAIVAGPVGAIVAGVIGALMVDNNNVYGEIEQLDLALVEAHHAQYTAQTAFEKKLLMAEQNYQNELLALQQNYQATENLQAQNLLMSLQFTTGSSEIAAHYQEQVSALASLLKRAKTMSIDLSGYTDLQGQKAKNQLLSQDRVNSVKSALVAQGINSNRINTFAFGEARPVVASVQNPVSFYDRRVVVNLHNSNSQTAQNH
jgi:sortase system peptidoglycan-associated protein